MSSARRLKAVRAALVELKKIKAKMDPASGLTVTILRGVDNEENTSQPVILQLADGLDAIMDAVIESVRSSEKLNIAFCKDELKELQELDLKATC